MGKVPDELPEVSQLTHFCYSVPTLRLRESPKWATREFRVEIGQLTVAVILRDLQIGTHCRY